MAMNRIQFQAGLSLPATRRTGAAHTPHAGSSRAPPALSAFSNSSRAGP